MNQRNNTDYNTNGFFCDMWYIYTFNPSVIYSIHKDYDTSSITATLTSGDWFDIRQNVSDLYYKSIGTISLIVNDTRYILNNILIGNILGGRIIIDGITVYSLPESAIVIRINKPGTYKIDWVKLELGTVATNYVHPIFADELIRCREYFIKMNTATRTNNYGYLGKTYISYHIPISMPYKIPFENITITNMKYSIVGQWDKVSVTNHAVIYTSREIISIEIPDVTIDANFEFGIEISLETPPI